MSGDELQGYIDNPRSLPANGRIALAQIRKAMRDLNDVEPKYDAIGLQAAAWAADRVEGGIDRTVHLTHKQEAPMSIEEAQAVVKQIGADKPADEF